jgi:hypothetical protein
MMQRQECSVTGAVIVKKTEIRIASVAVDISLRFPHKDYSICYKGLNFRYLVSVQPNQTDRVHFAYQGDSDFVVAYSKAREYLYALAFTYRGRVRVGGWITTSYPDLDAFSGGYYERREIPRELGIRDLSMVVDLNKDVQFQLLQLYVDAFSNPNVYFKILFYWHALVYPDKGDSMAVDYINNHLHIVDKRLFMGLNGHKNYGKYVKCEIRHAIAHIVRERKNAFSLKMGDLSQMSELTDVVNVLEMLARHRMETEYQMKGFASARQCFLRDIPL